MNCDITALQQQLVDAKRAYHELQTGRAVRVFVDQNGERVEYTAASGPRLMTYIRQLEQAIQTGNCNVFGSGRRGPIGFTF